MLATLAVLLAGGEEKAATASNPVIPDGAELFWGAVLFLTLLVLMRYVLLPPVLKVMAQREAAERDSLEAAEKALADAEKVRRDYEQTISEARLAASRKLDDARADADKERQALLAEVEAQISEAKVKAKADIAAARAAAISGARDSVSGLAAVAASKVLGQQVAPADALAAVDSVLASN